MEHCRFGSVENVLVRKRHTFHDLCNDSDDLRGRCDCYANADLLCTKDLIFWSIQIASGMKYLSSRKVNSLLML